MMKSQTTITPKGIHPLLILCIALVLLFLPFEGVFAQESVCALPDETSSKAGKRMDLGDAEAEVNFPIDGTVNALVVLVQHSNDVFEDCKQLTGYSSLGVPITPPANYANNCAGQTSDNLQINGYQSWTDDDDEWPLGASAGPDPNRTLQLPTWAEDLIDPPGSTSFTDGSLSDFYNKASNGALTLTGEVWDYVYVPELPFDEYSDSTYRTTAFANGRGAVMLSHEIISYVDSNPHGINLSASHWDLYTNGDGQDDTPDGIFDMIILLYRFSSLSTLDSTFADSERNVSSLGERNRTAGDSFASNPLTLGGYDVISNSVEGSGVIAEALTRKGALRIIGHEIGHRQFGLYHTDDVDLDPLVDPELEQTDFYSIMNGSAHMGVSAPDRIKVEWANVQNVDVTSISGSQAYTLRDALVVNSTEIDAIRFRNGTTDACGDIIVEARLQDHYLDKPPGIGNDDDGDGYDFYLPNEGLLVYKAALFGTGGCGSSFVRYSSMPNGGLSTRRKYFGSDANNPAGMHEPAFGPGDNYTPFTTIQHDFHDSPLDSEIAITDISISGNSVSFKVWEDFPQEVGGGTKRFVAPYAFDSEAVARISTWSLDGVFSQEAALNNR